MSGARMASVLPSVSVATVKPAHSVLSDEASVDSGIFATPSLECVADQTGVPRTAFEAASLQKELFPPSNGPGNGPVSGALRRAPAPFLEVARRVKTGSLAMTVVVGPARSGTTVSEKFIFETIGFDGNFNQPGLLGQRNVEAPRGRVLHIWERILAKVERLEQGAKAAGRDIFKEPITLVVKETLNCVIPGIETTLLQHMCSPTVVIVRNPWLQLASRIACILLRIEDGAMGPYGISAKLDPRTFTIAGYPLIKPGADFSHLQGPEGHPEGISLWVQHERHMKKTQNWSSLGEGFIRLCCFHPHNEDPDCQLEIWRAYIGEIPGIDEAMISANLGRKFEDFDNLPMPLALAFFDWDLSWTPFNSYVTSLEKHGGAPFAIVDFTDLQNAPMPTFETLRTMVPLTGTASKIGTYDFDMCSDGASWDQWYLKSCDWDLLAAVAGTKTSLRPATRPAPLPSVFPSFTASMFKKMGAIYTRALKHRCFVRNPESSPGADTMRKHANDKVYAFMYSDAAERFALWKGAPAFRPYFEALDASCSTDPTDIGHRIANTTSKLLAIASRANTLRSEIKQLSSRLAVNR